MSIEASRKVDAHHKGCSHNISNECSIDFRDLYLACHELVALAIHVASAHLRHIRAIKIGDAASPEHNVEPQSRAHLSCMETGFPPKKPWLMCL